MSEKPTLSSMIVIANVGSNEHFPLKHEWIGSNELRSKINLLAINNKFMTKYDKVYRLLTIHLTNNTHICTFISHILEIKSISSLFKHKTKYIHFIYIFVGKTYKYLVMLYMVFYVNAAQLKIILKMCLFYFHFIFYLLFLHSNKFNHIKSDLYILWDPSIFDLDFLKQIKTVFILSINEINYQ